MARIRPSGLIEDLAGLFAGLVFSKWKGLPYMRVAATTISNPQTPAQSAVRAAISELSKAYHKLLTPEQKANWETFAEGLGSQSLDMRMSNGGQGIIKPMGKVMSGYNAFVRCNLERLSVGYDYTEHMLLDAPLGINPPTPPLNLSLIYNPTGNHFEGSVDKPMEPGQTYEYENPVEETIEQPTRVRLWSKPPALYGRIQEVLEIEFPLDTNFICVITYKEYGEDKPIYAGEWAFQADAVSGYGLRSSPTSLVTVMSPVCCAPEVVALTGFEFVPSIPPPC